MCKFQAARPSYTHARVPRAYQVGGGTNNLMAFDLGASELMAEIYEPAETNGELIARGPGLPDRGLAVLLIHKCASLGRTWV